MRKLHAKVGTVLTVLLCVVLVLGVLGVAGAAETSYVLKGNDSGYIANSTAITLGPDTVVSMEFGVDFIRSEDGVKVGLGDGEVGFGIVDASMVNYELVNFDNDEYGFAVAYDETTNFIGGAKDGVQPKNQSLGMSKEDVMVEGKSYRVIFDNSTGEMFIESESTGTGTWYLIQHVTGIKSFEANTKVYLGFFYRGGVNMVLADVNYSSYLSTANAISNEEFDISFTDGVEYTDGTKVTTLNTKGNAFIANKTPIDNTVAESDYVISLSVSDFEAEDDITMTFALTTGTPADGKIKTGEEGLSFMLHRGTGVISDVNGQKEDHDAFVNATSVFSAGNKVKAVFKPSAGRFSLLINSGDKFVEWFYMEGLDIPVDNVTFGIEMTGKINANFYGFELYAPSDPDLVGQNITKFNDDHGIMSNDYGADLEYVSDGVTLETVKKNGFDPYGNIFSDTELQVNEGQMIAIVVDELIEYVPGVNRLQIFGFSFIKNLSDDVDKRQSSFGQNNNHISIDYDTHGRYTYYLCADYTKKSSIEGKENQVEYCGGKTLGDAFTFADIINEKEYGTSYMACYDPYDLVYYLYKKTFTEPDYTLISTVNLNNQTFPQDTIGWAENPYKSEMLDEFRADEDDNTFYAAVRLAGGMNLKFNDLKAFVINKADVGANDVHELMTTEDEPTSATLVNKGKNLYANVDGYMYTKNSVRIPDGHGLVMEYDIENVSYLAGTYNIGWMITNDLSVIESGGEVADATEVDNNITVQNSLKNATSKYSLLQFTGSSDLTPAFADNMRDTLKKSGTSFRVIFYNDGTMKLQTKLIKSYVWNDIEYGEPETGYVEGDPTKQLPNNSIWKYKDEDVYVGIRLQATYNLDVTDEVKIYLIEDETPYTDGVTVSGGYLETKPGTLRFADVRVKSSDDTRGTVKVTGNENIDESYGDVLTSSVYVDSEVTLEAMVENRYAFEGWYLDGKKISDDPITTVTVSSNSIYEANFVDATKVSVINGEENYETIIDNYYQNDAYMMVRPIQSVGYDFAGWNIRLIETDVATGDTITKESYNLMLKVTETENILPVLKNAKGEEISYNVWGSLSNAIVSGGTCSVEQEVSFNAITFGSFSVKERKGYEEGYIALKVPGLTCEYDENDPTVMTVERMVVLEALYDEKVTSIRDEIPYSEQYMKNMEYTTTVGICFIAVFVIGVAALIALKKYVSYKRDIKALIEYEFVLKENDKL